MDDDHLSDSPDSEHLRFLENLDRVNRAILGAVDLDEMMQNVLDTMLDIFDCDRAFLMYPCDPEADSWSIPMERSRPEYPGAGVLNEPMSMHAEVRENMRLLLAREGALKMGPQAERPMPPEFADLNAIKSAMSTALYPKTGKPWAFGIHQCSRDRIWSDEEERLMLEISRRLGDGLTSLLIMRGLRKSEEKYRRFVKTSNEGICALDNERRITFANPRLTDMTGYTEEELLGHSITDFLFPDDLADNDQRMSQRQQGISEHYERRFRRKDGSELWTLISAKVIKDDEGRFQGSFAMLADITDRKQMERDLMTRELDFRTLVENSSDPILRYDRNLQRTYINPVIHRISGKPIESLVGHTPEEEQLLSASEAKKLTEAIRRTFDRNQTSHVEFEFVDMNGTTHGYDMLLIPEHDADGQVQSVLGIARDITERKRAESELARSEEKFSKAFHASPNLMAITRMEDGSIVEINESFCRFFGYTREECIGHSTTELQMWVDPEQRTKALRKLEETGAALYMPLELRTKSGEIRSVIDSMTYINIDDQQYLLSVATDITEQKQAEQIAREKQELLLEAQRIAKLGNWEVWHQQNCSLVWSDEVYNIHEIDKESFDGSNESFLASIHPQDRQAVAQAHIHALNEHQDNYEISYRLLMNDGRVKFIHEMGRNYYDADGAPLRSVGTVQDLTHLHDVEEQLHQAQKMEAVGTLVGGIAHDFNNKLAAITGNLYLAKQLLDENSEAAERIKAVSALSFDAAMMVQQLLTFARKGTVKHVPVALASFIKETAKLNRLAIPENIRLSVDFDSNPLPVMGDITQLQQLFLNLLTNARDALDEVGDAHVEVALETYEPDQNFIDRHPKAGDIERFACMRICDNGCGIEPDHMEHIFDPFFTTKEVGKGTGLGLAMVYNIVQSHHGFIEVDSHPGKGTCFSIYLPLLDTTRGLTERREDMEIVKGEGETILLADDDASVRETFADVLGSLNYQVITARTGREAIDIYRQHAGDIDLVILDIVMPEMKGPDVANEIRAISPGVRLLFASGYGDQGKSGEALTDIGTLDKPFQLDQVSRIIRNHLDR